jgi:hypothetical protein
MTLYVYVDNSNLWIEGMRISAVRRGMATSLQDAMDRHITDHTWTYDFGKLYRADMSGGTNHWPLEPARIRPPRTTRFGS